MPQKLIVIFLLLLLPTSLLGQRTIGELDLPKGIAPQNLQCLTLKDTLFIIFRLPYAREPFKDHVSVRLSHDGKINQIGLPWDGVTLCGLTNYREETFLYSLENKNRNVVLSTVSLNSTKQHEALNEKHISITGKILGTSVRNEQLYLYSTEKKTFSLTVSKIAGQGLAEVKQYPLSIDLATYENAAIAFIPEGSHIGSQQACAPIKIYLRGEDITIIADETFDHYNENGQRQNKTTIIDINTVTGAQSIKTFIEYSSDLLTSAAAGNYLFRVRNNARELELRIYDLRNQSQLITKTIRRSKMTDEKMVFRRQAGTNRISEKETLSTLMKSGLPYIIASMDSLTEKYVLTVGTYDNSNGVVGPFGISGLAGIMVSVIGTGLLQMMDGPGISRYFYLEGDILSGLSYMDDMPARTLRQKIDLYEMQNKTQEKLLLSGCFKYNDGLVAAYYLPEISKLRFVEFRF